MMLMSLQWRLSPRIQWSRTHKSGTTTCVTVELSSATELSLLDSSWLRCNAGMEWANMHGQDDIYSLLQDSFMGLHLFNTEQMLLFGHTSWVLDTPFHMRMDTPLWLDTPIHMQMDTPLWTHPSWKKEISPKVYKWVVGRARPNSHVKPKPKPKPKPESSSGV